MSAQASDSNFIAFNISSQDKFQQNLNVQSLCEVSRIGKIWDKHRANTDKVLHYYAKADKDYRVRSISINSISGLSNNRLPTSTAL